ncbi:o-succinylbenzoate synthase [Afifella pfennigii]|uniref:o-succinylbenzoate synthase n=1 Tax=Afifella pfennigii TaxID=209897 RepID=UPI00068DF29E|nr:o-succinylbenzoate synthase [Afifella pfennigii]
MRIAAAKLRPYVLPLVRPWVAARATLAERRGMLLILRAEDMTGYGDCAPLPSSSTAGHEAAFAALASAARALPGRETDVILAEGLETIAVPEARWALETALLDLVAKARGLPLSRHLSADAAPSVKVNAALGRLDAGAPERAARAAAGGFAVAKIKVGVAPVAEELEALRDVAARAGAALAFRFDANRAWCEVEARRFLEALADMEGLSVDGVEEPLADPTPEGLARLQAKTPFPIAADESLPILGASALLEARAVKRLVAKPARLGGIAATLRLAQMAKAAGVETVLTSVVDSALGVTAAAHLAAALPGRPCATHGLATSAWLAEDVAQPPPIRKGCLSLPAAAGIGVVPHHILPGGEAFDG